MALETVVGRYNRMKEKYSLQSLRDAHPNLHFASTNGNAGGNGGIEDPWDIDTAFTSIDIGDTLYVRGGTYMRSTVLRPGPSNNGAASESDRITVTNFLYEDAWLDAGDFPDSIWGTITVDNYRDYVTINGLKIKDNIGTTNDTGSVAKGILYTYYSNYGIVTNNYITNHSSSGIKMNGTNHIIDGNEVYKCTYRGDQEGISVAGEISDVIIIRYNEVHECGGSRLPEGYVNGIGIDVKVDVTNVEIYGNHVHDNLTNGIYCDARGALDNIKIYSNFVHDNVMHGIKIGSETTDNTISNLEIFNNITARNLVGITLGQNGTPPNHYTNIDIVNNVVVDNTDAGFWIMTESTDPAKYPDNINIVNNIVMGNTAQFESFGENIHLDVYSIDTNIIIGTTVDLGQVNTIAVDPNFVDAENDNYKITGSSSAANTAVTGYFTPTNDYDGAERTGTLDIGAYNV